MTNFRTIISDESTFLTRDQANELVIILQSDDPEWSYRAIHDPSAEGMSFVEVLDEDNELLGTL
jgi:hypothetical protein